MPGFQGKFQEKKFQENSRPWQKFYDLLRVANKKIFKKNNNIKYFESFKDKNKDAYKKNKNILFKSFDEHAYNTLKQPDQKLVQHS